MEKITTRKKILVFFLLVGYFLLFYNILGYIPHYASLEAATFIDKIIPLVPFFVIFYLIGFVFSIVPLFITEEKKEFYWLAFNYFLILTVSFVMFVLIPIEFKKDFVLGTDFFSRLIESVQAVDSDFNNFPSLHVSLNFFTVLFVKDKNPKLGLWLLPIPILIIFSTMFVKQHLFIDVIGGIVIAALFFYIFKRYRTQAENYFS
ncbi:phosphatase PAP2 family protein [Candidatus Woesearchaeota archaeon]|nr:phosphatase PAP2 family protein [Candidatus Woesearchaeota archaeon]